MNEKKEGFISKIFKKLDENLKKKAEKSGCGCESSGSCCSTPDKDKDNNKCCS